MLLNSTDVPDMVWARIRASAAASPDAMTLLILTALDVDALATCSMLSARPPLRAPRSAVRRHPLPLTSLD